MLQEINFPYSIELNFKSKSKVIRISKIDDIAKLKKIIENSLNIYAKNTKSISFYFEDLSMIKKLKNINIKKLNIFFDVTVSNLFFIYKNKNLLDDFYLTALFDKDIKNSDIANLIIIFKNLNIKSFIYPSLFMKIDKNSMQELLERVILKPDIVENVEPFYTMASYIFEKKTLKKHKINLWTTFKEEFKKYLYLDHKNISLSKEFIEKGKYFTKIENFSINNLQQNDFLKEYEDFEMELFYKHMDCATCQRYEFCKGYFRYKDEDYKCDIFINLLEQIDKNFNLYKEKKVA